MFHTLTRQVIATTATFLLLLVVAGIISVATIFENQNATSELTQNRIKEIDTTGHFNTLMGRAIGEVFAFARTGEPEDRAEAQAALVEAESNLATLSGFSNERFNAQEQNTRIVLQQRRVLLFQQVRQYVGDAIRALEAGNDASADRALEVLEQFEADSEQIETESDALELRDGIAVSAAFANGTRRDLVIVAGLLLSFMVLGAVIVVLVRRRIIQPINRLVQAVGLVAQGDLDQRVAVQSNNEIGQLQRAFNEMISELHTQRTVLEDSSAELRSSVERQQQLLATVQQLSAPLLPLWEGVLVLPIVGYVDSTRAAALLNTLLTGISQRRAHNVILDVTGLAAVDQGALDFIQQAVQAGRLLGAQMSLAGMNGETAQRIVAQDVQLGQIRTFRDLHSAVEAALPASDQQDGPPRTLGPLARMSS